MTAPHNVERQRNRARQLELVVLIGQLASQLPKDHPLRAQGEAVVNEVGRDLQAEERKRDIARAVAAYQLVLNPNKHTKGNPS
jgi:hypothetical protein